MESDWWTSIYGLTGGQVAYVLGGIANEAWNDLSWFSAVSDFRDAYGEPRDWPAATPEWNDWLTWRLKVRLR